MRISSAILMVATAVFCGCTSLDYYSGVPDKLRDKEDSTAAQMRKGSTYGDEPAQGVTERGRQIERNLGYK